MRTFDSVMGTLFMVAFGIALIVGICHQIIVGLKWLRRRLEWSELARGEEIIVTRKSSSRKIWRRAVPVIIVLLVLNILVISVLYSVIDPFRELAAGVQNNPVLRQEYQDKDIKDLIQGTLWLSTPFWIAILAIAITARGHAKRTLVATNQRFLILAGGIGSGYLWEEDMDNIDCIACTPKGRLIAMSTENNLGVFKEPGYISYLEDPEGLIESLANLPQLTRGWKPPRIQLLDSFPAHLTLSGPKHHSKRPAAK